MTSEHAALLAGVPWAAVQVYEPSRPVVLLAASVLCGGRVRVRVQPSAFMKACTPLEECEAVREAKSVRGFVRRRRKSRQHERHAMLM